MKKYVAYYRVSKDSHESGRSKAKGLGLEAQRTIVEHYFGESIVKDFTETKSAKDILHRPILQEAIDYCVRNYCWLVVAKLDRLSRSTIDVLSIVKTLSKRVSFCDIPSEGEADEFMITIFAAIATRERELIGIRTSQALQVKLKREGYWGSNSDKYKKHQDVFVKSGDFSKMGVEANRKKAFLNENTIRATEMIIGKRRDGLTYAQIADFLNSKKFVTSEGDQFSGTQVWRMLKRSKNEFRVLA